MSPSRNFHLLDNFLPLQGVTSAICQLRNFLEGCKYIYGWCVYILLWLLLLFYRDMVCVRGGRRKENKKNGRKIHLEFMPHLIAIYSVFMICFMMICGEFWQRKIRQWKKLLINLCWDWQWFFYKKKNIFGIWTMILIH